MVGRDCAYSAEIRQRYQAVEAVEACKGIFGRLFLPLRSFPPTLLYESHITSVSLLNALKAVFDRVAPQSALVFTFDAMLTSSHQQRSHTICHVPDSWWNSRQTQTANRRLFELRFKSKLYLIFLDPSFKVCTVHTTKNVNASRIGRPLF